MPYVTASTADRTARAVGREEQRSLLRSRARSAPLLHRLRTLRQIAGPTGRREIDKGIGAAAAERNDMIAFEALVRTAIGAGVSVALQNDAADDVPILGRKPHRVEGAYVFEALGNAGLHVTQQRQD